MQLRIMQPALLIGIFAFHFSYVIADNHELPLLSIEELREKMTDLLETRPERPDSPDLDDHDGNFEALFGDLRRVATSWPGDVEFDFDTWGPQTSTKRRDKIKDNECMKNPLQFSAFLRHVRDVMFEMREEWMEEVEDQRKDALDAIEATGISDGIMDMNTGASEDTSESATMDDVSDVTDLGLGGDMKRRKRDVTMDFDLDEILDRFDDDDVECLATFVSDSDQNFLCHRFAQRSSNIFRKILASGADCNNVLLSEEERDDDDSNDRLNEAHQLAILHHLQRKVTWTSQDVHVMLRLAPDVIDDDVLEVLPEALLLKNLHHFGLLAARRAGNPRLRYALRHKVDTMLDGGPSSEAMRQIGAGLMSLRLDQIDKLDGDTLLTINPDDILDDYEDDDHDDNMQTPSMRVKKHDDDDDDEEDEDDDGIRLALGRVLKGAMRRGGTMTQNLGKAIRYLHDDLEFIRSIEPDDMFDRLDDLNNLDLDGDDATSIYSHLSQASTFPGLNTMTGAQLVRLGRLVRGMGEDDLDQLDAEAVKEAMQELSTIEFDDFQAEELFDDIYPEDQLSTLTAIQIRALGTLSRGMTPARLNMISHDVIDEVMDDLDDMELTLPQRMIILQMARTKFGNRTPIKIMSTDDFAELLSLDEIDELDDLEFKASINISAHVNWRQTQAVALAMKYKRALGMRRLRPSDLADMGHVARGLLPADIEDMAETMDDLLDLAEELRETMGHLSSGQVDALANKVEDFGDIRDIVIDEKEALQASHVLAFLPSKAFKKLKFTTSGKKSFVSQVSKMATTNLARGQMAFLAKWMLSMIDDFTEDTTRDVSDIEQDSRRLRMLGKMALGLSPEQWRDMEGRAVFDNMDILSTLPFTGQQAAAILERVNSWSSDWNCRGDALARVGPLLQHMDVPFGDDCDDEVLSSFSAVMHGLDKHQFELQKRLKAGFSREDNELLTDDKEERHLVAAILGPAMAGVVVRRKRATTEGALTCDLVKHLRGSARLVDPMLLSAMTEKDFRNCLSALGGISAMPKESIAVLVNKMKQVYGPTSTWSSVVIRRAGVIMAGVNVTDFGNLDLRGVDTMNSVAKHGRLSHEQLVSGFNQWLSLYKNPTGGNTDITRISPAEFASLSEFVCGLNIKQITKLPNDVFKRSLEAVGHALTCNPDIRHAYAAKAAQVYGVDPALWSPALVGDMGHLVGALSDRHVTKLTVGQLSVVTPVVIQGMPEEALKSLSVSQLGALSPNQANAITEAQYKALDGRQRGAVAKRATVAFLTARVGGNTGSPSVTLNAVVIAVMAVTSLCLF